MNISTSESTLVLHFSAAKVDHVDELDGVLVGYDERDRIVDVAVRAKKTPARVDFVENDLGAFPARVTYDAEVDAIAVDFGTSTYAGSDEILPGFIVDRDDDGFIRGLEFLNASRFFSEEAISDVRKRAILLRAGTRS
jgi:uncharacterized protein YuzE